MNDSNTISSNTYSSESSEAISTLYEAQSNNCDICHIIQSQQCQSFIELLLLGLLIIFSFYYSVFHNGEKKFHMFNWGNHKKK